jgi:hypothetical protein
MVCRYPALLTHYRPPSLKTFVQRCYEGVVNDETKNAIEKEMKQVILFKFVTDLDNYTKSSRWFVMDYRLGFNAITEPLTATTSTYDH